MRWCCGFGFGFHGDNTGSNPVGDAKLQSDQMQAIYLRNIFREIGEASDSPRAGDAKLDTAELAVAQASLIAMSLNC
jgi:hypothetical protein